MNQQHATCTMQAKVSPISMKDLSEHCLKQVVNRGISPYVRDGKFVPIFMAAELLIFFREPDIMDYLHTVTVMVDQWYQSYPHAHNPSMGTSMTVEGKNHAILVDGWYVEGTEDHGYFYTFDELFIVII